MLPVPSAGKIDRAVLAAIDSGSPLQVLIIGSRQLLAPVGGIERFAAGHMDSDRLALRRSVIRDLRSIATDQQSRVLTALGKPRAQRTLWMVNAMVLTLTPDEVRRAATLGDVGYIYRSAEELPSRPDSAGVEIALPRASSTGASFALGSKRVPWNVRMLRAPEAWSDLRVTGHGVRVAVLDFGTNYAHPDLAKRVWRNPGEIPNNRMDDDGNGYVDDYYGYDFGAMRAEVRLTTGEYQHGTVTAGIVAGDGTGGIVTGIAPDAELMLMLGVGPTAATLAYQYAAEHGADILSMSFSIPDLANLRGYWRMLSDHATAAGMLLVGGAGNFRASRAIPLQLWSPKDVPTVIAMAGVDSALQRTSFSSGGPVEWESVALYGDYPMAAGLRKPDMVAFPGPDYPILGAADGGYVEPNPKVAGNSFSGPQGAGVAALIFSAAPWLPVWRAREIMERTSRDLGPPGPDNEFGFGLIDAYAAVQEATRLTAQRRLR
ncbi:MAG: S8 family serine peptidase [Cytophagaceae bacterium]|nr:S8 family serine peptidase [Gemmatimonadaceae bacterium]